MTSSSGLHKGSLHALFQDGFRKSEHDFLIALYENLSYVMLCFRDSDALLLVGNGVIMISPPWGASGDFFCRFLKEQLKLTENDP